MKPETKTIDIILRSMRTEYLAPSHVLLRPHHESRTYIRRALHAINQYIGGDQIFQHKGAKEQEARAGSAVLIRAGILYRSMNPDVGKTRRRGISFRFAIMGGQDPLVLLETPFVMDRKIGDFIGELNRELFAAEAQENFLLSATLRAGIGMRLLEKIILLSTLKADALARLEHYNRLQTVFEYIHQNFQEQIPVDKLAELAGLSVSRFFKVFQEASGISPNQYVLNFRLSRAQELLIGDACIHKIASLTGFGDQFYFSRIFKNKLGLSPSLFRARNRREH
ncbi:MAG: hypothetical protein A2017_03285 [Lentisphaerae bacterium GWF2_44_16]|nr:MAG: hypothetical protein A2017_03285 [Lentisphaerae bacterium GWF2_44_16]